MMMIQRLFVAAAEEVAAALEAVVTDLTDPPLLNVTCNVSAKERITVRLLVTEMTTHRMVVLKYSVIILSLQ